MTVTNMNRLFWMIGLALYVIGVLILTPTSNVNNAHVATCNATAETNSPTPDGKHSGGGGTPGPLQQSAGSCSISTSASEGQLTHCGAGIGPCHFIGQSAFSGPPSPPNTATCASSSAGLSGITASFAGGSTQNGFCTHGVHST
ncbi:MAG TPA: hypothetical protein VFI73_05235 [Candidatus Nitrosopolaris sp.]|nr:hypothetical protein [Candidatus Nitrosopolaris sp.]